MENINRWVGIAVIGLCCFFIQGCVVAAVGASVAAVKYGNAKKADAKAKNQGAYNQYVIGMQEINLKRQKAGLKPEKIMSFNEYNGNQN